MFGNPADGGFLKPPATNKSFTHSKAEVAILNRTAWSLFWDVEVLIGMARVRVQENRFFVLTLV